MTHSPAPWRYVPKSGQIVDANNRQIGRIWHTSNHERDHANGELIADAAHIREAYGNLCGEAAELIARQDNLQEALALCVKAIDHLLPGAKHIPCDVGLINQALIAARPLIEESHDPGT